MSKGAKENRPKGRCVDPVVCNAAFRGAAPEACSSGLETGDEDRSSRGRTLSLIKDFFRDQSRQVRKAELIRNGSKIEDLGR